VCDRVLDRASVQSGDTVVDVGAGTGLLTFGALERLGPDGEVIAADVSVDALEELRRLAREHRINGRLSLQLGEATVLPLPDDAVDAVVTRSVLIFVRDKAEAAREFFRVLRPGGRFSLFEPINAHNPRLYELIDFTPLGDLAERVAADEEARYASDDPMVDFDEHDLERAFADAGFEVDAELRTEDQTVGIELILHGVGAPGRPTRAQEWQEAFSPAEADELEAFVRSRADSLTFRWTHLYLAGRKPA
jgi:ubiquinone/menaquinone biosynthesis C-methylase UbiE